MSYRKALQLDPNFAEAHLNLGFAYQRLNKPKQAAAEYEKGCALSAESCRTPAKSGVAPR